MRHNFFILLSVLAGLQAGCTEISGSHTSLAPSPKPPSSGNFQVSVAPNPANVRAVNSQ
ncbi:MAG: hypothetical protein WBR10_17145 [Candidatus Acidiferrum sp.]